MTQYRDLMSRRKITEYLSLCISRFIRANLTVLLINIKFFFFRRSIFYFSYRTAIVFLQSITFSPRLLSLRRIAKKAEEKKNGDKKERDKRTVHVALV